MHIETYRLIHRAPGLTTIKNSTKRQLEIVNSSIASNTGVQSERNKADASANTPISTKSSDDGDDSHISFTSQTISNDGSVLASDMKHEVATNKSPCSHPMRSILKGKTSIPMATGEFNSLASMDPASARPFSPILSTRKSRFSRFFPSTQHDSKLDDQKANVVKKVGPALNGLCSLESSSFPESLSKCLLSTMPDKERLYKRTLENEASGYAASSQKRALYRADTAVHWSELVAAAQTGMNIMPLTVPGNASGTLQTPVITLRCEEQAHLTSNLPLSVYKPDGVSLPQQTECPQMAHNPRAAAFIPRPTTRIENIEQTAGGSEEQKRFKETRNRPSWDIMSNWRIRESAEVRLRDEGPPRSATISSSGCGNVVEDAQSSSVIPMIPLDSAPVLTPISSQALNRSRFSTSVFGTITISKRGRSRAFEAFRPMNTVVNPGAYKQPLSEADIAFREENGISLNYRGNHENPRNISANIPDSENCAVWITNLPTKCTQKDLLQALMLHRPGRVWATHVSGPAQPKHRHAAAKLVFYHPDEAKRFLELSRQPGIFVEDRRISAIYNKQRVPAQKYSRPTSRALEIRGDKAIVNEKFLRSLFVSHFKFEDEAVEVLAEFGNTRVIEWRFGSMRAQAASAYSILERMYPCVDIRYATDPCAQYIIMPHKKQHRRLVAPLQDRFSPESSFDGPEGPMKISRSISA